VGSGGFRRHVRERFACRPCDEAVSTHLASARRRQGVAAKGLEPCESGRQLEQQREQLPCGEPQQQQPDEPEQQPWVPCGLAPSSTRLPEGGGADPAAIPSGAKDGAQANRDSEPPGASREAELSKSSGRSLGLGGAVPPARPAVWVRNRRADWFSPGKPERFSPVLSGGVRGRAATAFRAGGPFPVFPQRRTATPLAPWRCNAGLDDAIPSGLN
jgi:hypothetical protein